MTNLPATTNEPGNHGDSADFREERKALLRTIWSFYDLKVLSVALDCGLFRALLREPGEVAALARACAISERGARTLLICLTALGLAKATDGGVYSATEKARRHFASNGPDSLAATVDWANTQFDALTRLGEAVKHDRIVWDGFDHYIENPEAERDKSDAQEHRKLKAFTDVLAGSAHLVAHRVMEAVDLSGARHLLDVGGNVGVFAGTILERHPHMHATVFDLPAVVEVTRERAATSGLAARMEAEGGDFMRDAWPRGADVITFIRMNVSRPRAELLHLMKKAYEALPPGGKLILFEENVLDANRNDVPHLSIWAAVLFFMGSRGETRRVDEWVALFEEAGFAGVQSKLGKPWGIVWGTKPQ
ncbi:hypothetical protein LVJ94_30420 [Pendulispora rubella]|uniref:O-methyltransferase n=1 Tax=Pendulispora rubella TaxID=2741070 RepID=A0ABZ2KRE0_9BACT